MIPSSQGNTIGSQHLHYEPTLNGPVQAPFMSSFRKLVDAQDSDRFEVWKEIQGLLNGGNSFTKEEIDFFESEGYSITKNPATIERFRDYIIPNQTGLTELIQAATPIGGLLIDHITMFQPGPASVKNGAAKGIEEINQIFENHSNARLEMNESIANCLLKISSHLPPGFEIVVPETNFEKEKIYNFLKKTRNYTDKNRLFIFVYQKNSFDTDFIFSQLQIDNKESDEKIQSIEDNLKTAGFVYKTIDEDSQIFFPPLTEKIKAFLATIKRGDYENLYEGIDQDQRIFKALIEFIAKRPLEAFRQDDISKILNVLEKIFVANRGNYLQLCNRLIIPCPSDCDTDFLNAFNEINKKGKDFEYFYRKSERFLRLGCAKSAQGVLTPAIQTAFDRMCTASRKKRYSFVLELVRGFQMLANIHLQLNNIPEAAGLLWYAKRLEKRHGKNSAEMIEQIDHAIDEIEKKYPGPNGNRQELQTLRAAMFEELKKLETNKIDLSTIHENMKDLYAEMNVKIKAFFNQMVQECIDRLGNPPCKYAFLATGSFAKGECSFFSDLEFVIVTERKQDLNGYFEQLLSLIQLKSISLGETPINQLGISALSMFDDTTPQGMTIKGKLWDGDLQDIKEGAFVAGSIEIIEALKNKLTFQQSKNNKNLAVFLCRENLKQIDQDLEANEMTYRFVETFLDGFAHYYSLESYRSLDRIQELSQFGKITKEGAEDLQRLFTLTQLLQLESYFNNDKEDTLLQAKEKIFYEFYYNLLPFKKAVENFCKSIEKDGNPSLPNRFYASTHYIKGSVQKQLKNYERAEESLKGAYNRLVDENYFSRSISLGDNDLSNCIEMLGDVQEGLKKYSEAIKSYEKTIETSQRQPPTQKAKLYKKLADVYKKIGNFQKALHLAEKTLDLTITMYGKRDSNTALSYSEVADLLSELDRDQEALDLATKAFKINLEIRGKKHPLTVGSYLDRGRQLKKLGRYTEAMDSLTTGLEISDELFGDDHPIITTFYKEMQSILIDWGRRKEALENAQKALQINQEYYGEYHLITLESHCALSDVLKSMKKHQDAHKIARGAWETSRLLSLGQNTPTVNFYTTLANTLYGTGNCEEAHIAITKALEINMQIFGESNPNTAMSYLALANFQSQMNMFTDAIETFDKALHLMQKLYGKESPKVAVCYNDLGRTFFLYDDYQEALKYFKQSLEINIQFYGQLHPRTLENYQYLGKTLLLLDKYVEALEILKKGFKLSQQLFGPTHPLILDFSKDLMKILIEIGQYEEALELPPKALKISMEIFGESHPTTAQIYYSWGVILSGVEDEKKAVEKYLKALEIQKTFDTRGELYTLVSLGNSYRHLGRFEEALKIQNQALEISMKIDYDSTDTIRKSLEDTQMEFDLFKEATKKRENDLVVGGKGEINKNLFSNDVSPSAPNSSSAIPILALRALENAKRLAKEAREFPCDDGEDYEKKLNSYEQAIKAYSMAIKFQEKSGQVNEENNYELKKLQAEKNKLKINALAKDLLPDVEIRTLENQFLNLIDADFDLSLKELVELTDLSESPSCYYFASGCGLEMQSDWDAAAEVYLKLFDTLSNYPKQALAVLAHASKIAPANSLIKEHIEIREDLIRIEFKKLIEELNGSSTSNTTCFVCYVWENDVGEWLIHQLIPDLRLAGIKPLLDLEAIEEGKSLIDFQAKISSSETAIVVCTPLLFQEYFENPNSRPVLEMNLLKNRFINSEQYKTIIPVLFKGKRSKSNPFPLFEELIWADLRRTHNYYHQVLNLIGTLKKLEPGSTQTLRLTFEKKIQTIIEKTNGMKLVKERAIQQSQSDSQLSNFGLGNKKEDRQPIEIPSSLQNTFISPVQLYEGLQAQIKSLNSLSKETNIIIINGVPGSGKTQLALNYAKTYKDDYQLIFFIDSYNRESIENGLQAMADQLELPPMDHGEMRLKALKLILSQLNNKNGLIIFENMNRSLTDYLSYFPKKWLLMITSRGESAFGQLGKAITTQPVSNYEAVQDVLTKTNDKDIESAKELVNRLTTSPIAIAQAITFMQKKKMKVREYLSLLTQLQLKPESDTHPTINAVHEVLELTLQSIQTKDPFALQLIYFVSILNGCVHDFNLIEKWQQKFYPTNDEKLQNSLDFLCSYSLLQKSVNSSPNVYLIHPLVQEIIRANLAKNNRELFFSLQQQMGELLAPSKPTDSYEESNSFEALIHVLRDPQADSDAKKVVVATLGNISEGKGTLPKEAKEALIQLLLDPKVDSDAKWAGAKALGKIAQGGGALPKEALDALIQFIRDPQADSDAKWAGAKALGAIAQGGGALPKEALDALIQFIRDPQADSDAKWAGADALASIAAGGGALSKESLEALIQFIRDPQAESDAKCSATETLEKITNRGMLLKEAVAGLIHVLRNPRACIDKKAVGFALGKIIKRDQELSKKTAAKTQIKLNIFEETEKLKNFIHNILETNQNNDFIIDLYRYYSKQELGEPLRKVFIETLGDHPLANVLVKIPNQLTGYRYSYSRSYDELNNYLSLITTTDSTVWSSEGVRVKVSTIEYGESGLLPPTDVNAHTSAMHVARFLKNEVAEQLLDRSQIQAFAKKQILTSPLIIANQYKNTLNEKLLQFEEGSTNPFIHFAITSLMYRLFGRGAIPVTLGKITLESKDERELSIPVILSLTTPGTPLSELKKPAIEALKKESPFSEMLISQLLFQPSDSQTNPFVLQYDELVCVDQNAQFIPIKQPDGNQASTISSCSTLFNFGEGELSKEVIKSFLEWRFDRLIFDWLRELDSISKNWSKLFDQNTEKEIRKDLVAGWSSTFSEDRVIRLVCQLIHLQQIFQKNQDLPFSKISNERLMWTTTELFEDLRKSKIFDWARSVFDIDRRFFDKESCKKYVEELSLPVNIHEVLSRFESLNVRQDCL